VLTAIVVVLASGFVLYRFPVVDAPAAVDVVDVIGPPNPGRMAIAHRLLADGDAKALVVTTFPDPADPDNPDELFTPHNLEDCAAKQVYPVYCVTPDPLTTQGESRELATLARQHGWTSAIVITQTSHITRARVIMDACFPGSVRMEADTTPIGFPAWVQQFAYQDGAFLKLGLTAAIERGSYCTVTGRQGLIVP
jgi:hypothetical protein